MRRVRIKVCCISSAEEAELAIAHGADALGLVGEMPSGPGIIDDHLVRDIAAMVPPGVDTFLLTSQRSGAGIADHAAKCGTTTVQIVQHIDPMEYAVLMRELPAVRRVQVIHVEDETALELLPRYQPYVHAFLLDSGRPNAATAELGGTGRTHDWRLSAEIVRRADKPVFLAGGLGPDNVAQALHSVKPFGLDLCSGLRTNNQLDAEKLAQFVSRVWE